MQLLLSTLTAAVDRMRLAGADHAVIRTRDGLVHLDTTGRDSLPSSSTKLGFHDDPEERLVSSPLLTNIAQSLAAGAGPDAQVQLDFDDTCIYLTCGRSRARLATGDAHPDVAQVPYLEGETFEWTPNLAEAFRVALRFTENDNDKVTGQVSVEPGWVVATDSFTLCARRISDDLPPMRLPAVVTALAKCFDKETTCTLSKDRLQFEDELGHAVVALYAGGHSLPPTWKTLVELPDDGFLQCDRKELLAAIAAAVVRPEVSVTLFIEEDEIAVRGRSKDNDWIEHRIDGFGQTSTGEPIVGVALRFNADFLARCVSTVDMEGPLRISLRPLNGRTPHQGFTAIKHAGTTVLVQPQRSM